jgi:hypothetical protein
VAQEPPVLAVDLRSQAGDYAEAGLSRRASEVSRCQVLRIEVQVDAVGAVLQEGGVDLDLAQIVGLGRGGDQEK